MRLGPICYAERPAWPKFVKRCVSKVSGSKSAPPPGSPAESLIDPTFLFRFEVPIFAADCSFHTKGDVQGWSFPNHTDWFRWANCLGSGAMPTCAWGGKRMPWGSPFGSAARKRRPGAVTHAWKTATAFTFGWIPAAAQGFTVLRSIAIAFCSCRLAVAIDAMHH